MEDEENKSKIQAGESGFRHYRSATDWNIGGIHDFDGIVTGADNVEDWFKVAVGIFLFLWLS